MLSECIYTANGGGNINYDMTTIDSGASTDSEHSTPWYETTIPSESVISVYVKSRSYNYDGYFAVVNGTLTWVHGSESTYKYFRVDTSGTYLKIGQEFGSSSQQFDFVTTVKE